jgi:hypothetical protein
MALSVKNPFTLGNTVEGLLGGGTALADALLSGPGNDPTLNTALPAEASLRNRLNFANIKIGFPTSGGPLPLANVITATALTFPAYLTNFSQTFSTGFSSIPVYGRNDAIPTYKGTTRSIIVGLKIPCFDEQDANENMKKLNIFIKNIYPHYNEFKGDLIMGSPPLARVKFANLIVDPRISFRGLLGYIQNFSFSFNAQDGFFMDKDEGSGGNLFFRELSISFTLNVLHEKVIGTIDGEANNPSDFPFRVKHDIFNPVQQRSATDLKKQFGLSGDLSEAKILR